MSLKIYYDKDWIDNTVKSLLKEAIFYFKSNNRIKYIKYLIEILKNHNICDHFLDYQKLFFEERLIDAIKMILCFEYLLKADLISRGYIVHFYKGWKPGESNLIKISDLNWIGDDCYFEKFKINEFNTISFSKLLELKESNLPGNIKAIITKEYFLRNRLHFSIAGKSHAIEPAEGYELILIDFLNKELIEKYNSLSDDRESIIDYL